MSPHLRFLPAVAVAVLLGFASYHAFWGPDPTAAMSPKLRGLDLVSFWVPGKVLDDGHPELMYDPKQLKAEFKALHPSKPPGYPVGYPPPVYQLAAIPQPSLAYLPAVKAMTYLVALAGAAAGALSVLAVRVPDAMPRREEWRLWALGLGIGFPGTVSAVISGQLGGWWSLSMAAALTLRARAKPFLGGLFLGLLWMKPTLALPVAAGLLLLGEWALLGGMIGGGAVVLAASLAADGLAPWQAYLARMLDTDKILDDFWIYRHRQFTARSLAGTLVWVKEWREPIGWVAGALAAVGTALLAWRTRGATEPLHRDLVVGAVLAAALFAGPHMFEYDHGLNIFAVAAGSVWIAAGRARWPRVGMVAVALAWEAPMLTLIPVASKWGIAGMSILFWLAWMGAELLRERRDGRLQDAA